MPKAPKAKGSQRKTTATNSGSGSNSNKRSRKSPSPLPAPVQSEQQARSRTQSLEPPMTAASNHMVARSRTPSVEVSSSRPGSSAHSRDFANGLRENSKLGKAAAAAAIAPELQLPDTIAPDSQPSASTTSTFAPPTSSSTREAPTQALNSQLSREQLNTNASSNTYSAGKSVPIGSLPQGGGGSDDNNASSTGTLQPVDMDDNIDVIALRSFAAVNAIQRQQTEKDIKKMNRYNKLVLKHPAVVAKHSLDSGAVGIQAITEKGITKAEFDAWVAYDLAEADPAEVAELQRYLRNMPRQTPIQKVPQVNWRKYGILPQRTNKYTAQAPEQHGPINLAALTAPNPPPFQPGPEDDYRNVPRGGFTFNWKDLEGGKLTFAYNKIDDHHRLAQIPWEKSSFPL